jgi:hypothetical protein
MPIDPTYRLLSLCARAEGHPAFAEQLAAQAREFTAWQGLPAQAELHGMAPLLWHHLRNAQLEIPAETARTLRGLYLRHRLNNQIHTRVLLELVEILGRAGIQPLVLKGLALACEYYSDPALRPVSDIDLLFKQDEVLPALRLLKDAGFEVKIPTSRLLPKSIVVTAPLRDGLRVSIEAHHYDPKGRAPNGSRDDEFIGFDSPPKSVSVEEGTFYVPSPLETLLYLSRHLERHLFETTAAHPLQLKWTADIVSLVERHAILLDWDSLRRDHPELLTRLELFYSLTPIPEALAGILPIRRIAAPADCNQYPNGWPHNKIGQWKRVGFLRFLRQTFAPPSVWWLRLVYGIDERSAFWYGRVIYPLQVINLAFWAVVDSLGW